MIFRSGTKPNFCLLLVAVLSFSACADEQERGRKLCSKAAQLAGSLCLEGNSGAEGDVRIRVYATANVTEVNLSELGGSADAPRDGTPNTVNPGSGKVYWNSDNFTHFLTITLNAAAGNPGRYAPLIRPSGNGSKGATRTFTLFLSGSEYAFVLPE
ncbi:MAG: hypothetical protein HOI10_10490 [Deltaproteobacteria bacterium]|nr:hypothetical protein [Deltaproteobacteria bacterium]